MIFLTGATGTVGSELVKSLQARKAAFKVGARTPEKAKALGLDAVLFDWDKPETYANALAGADHAYLLPHVSERQSEFSNLFVDAAKAAGVKHLVKLSVTGADQEPGIALGRQHRATEKHMEASGLAWTMVRPTFFIQNFINYYGADPTKDSTIYLPNGDGKVTWIDAADIADVSAVALTTPGHEGKSYELTGAEALSTAEVAAILTEEWGHTYNYVNVPEEAARKGMSDMGMPASLVEGMLELNMIIRNGWSANTANGVETVLGRAPRTVRAWAKSAKR